MVRMIRTGMIIMICFVALKVCPAAEKKSETLATTAGTVKLYDTIEPTELSETLASLVTERKWKTIAEGTMPNSFAGDAVLMNDKVSAIIRKNGGGINVYAKSIDGWARRALLVPVVGKDVVRLMGPKVTVNDGTASGVEVCAGSAGIITISMNAGEPVLKTTAKGKVDSLRITAPCRIGILPDFLADDLMIDARQIPIARTEIPSDNFFLHMTGNGNTIVSTVWEKNERDVVLNLSGHNENRVIESSEIFFGSGGGAVFVAILEHKGIWYEKDFTRDDGMKGITLSEWVVPFAAKWKGNFTRTDKSIQSMQFTSGEGGIRKKDGKLTISLEAKRDAIESGVDGEIPPDYPGLSGVGVFYPLSRTDGTPLNQLCIDDLLRMCLGTGPCESIVDLESRKPTSKGIFTCSFCGMLQRLFPEGSLPPEYVITFATRLKDERYFIRRCNRNVMTFVKNVADRIDTYVEFGLGMLAYLDELEKNIQN